jgi:5-(carboxyamino)imidazole ribonucleotide mutase
MKVAIIMGSASDLPVMQPAADALERFGVPYEMKVVSAHRSPDYMYDFAKTADEQGFGVIIAGAGGAAHLPGMVAALSILPVIGVPVRSRNSIDGWDSLLSIVQMPNDVPVATVAVNGAYNAGVLAVQMLAIHDGDLRELLYKRKEQLSAHVAAQNEQLKNSTDDNNTTQ